MAEENCTQTVNIPSVDNTPLDCEPLAFTCVISEEAFPYLGLSGGEDLKIIMAALVDKVMKQAIDISALNSRIEVLENE